MRVEYIKAKVAQQLHDYVNISSQLVAELQDTVTEEIKNKELSSKDIIAYLDRLSSIQETAFKTGRVLNNESTDNIAIKVQIQDLIGDLQEKAMVPAEKVDLLDKDLSRGYLTRHTALKNLDKDKENSK